MKKERLKILEMVEAGTINVDEAAKLLEALKANADADTGWGGISYEDTDEKLNQFSKNIDAFARDFRERFSTTFKEVEPKLKSATKVALEKTVAVIDEVSKSLRETVNNMEECKDDCHCCCSDKPEAETQEDTPPAN